MADWVDIDNTTIEPDAPLISSTVFALRDNPKAIAEGAAGAPRVEGQQGPVVKNAGVFNGELGAEKFQAGTTERDWVLGRTADATAGSIGTYAILVRLSKPDNEVSANDLLPGSELRYTGRNESSSGGVDWSFGGTPSGTWRAMGTANTGTSATRQLIWLRVS